jgi:hypothetical protein
MMTLTFRYQDNRFVLVDSTSAGSGTLKIPTTTLPGDATVRETLINEMMESILAEHEGAFVRLGQERRR